MNRRIAFPFLTLSDAAVSAEPWSLSLDGGRWQTADGFVPDWDPASEIRIRRTMRIDPLIAEKDLGIAAGLLRLACGYRVATGTGRLPRLILRRAYHELAPGTWEKEFDIQVPGDRLSLVFDVQTQVMLAAPPEACKRLSPRQVASRLWTDTLRFLLEEEEPRFPMEVTDLRGLLGDAPAAKAPWFLYWSPGDWNRDFHGAVRLYLNRSHSDFIRRIEELDGPTLQVLLADVMGQVCERLVTDPEVDEIMAAAEPGSLAVQATAWLDAIWPGKKAAFVRSVLEQRPGRFRAAFLELAELGEV